MPNQFETVEELAARLKVCRTWIYERTRKNEIPHIRCGRYIRFEPEKVDNWLREQTEKISDS